MPLQSQRDTALRFQELEAERSDLSLSVLVGQLESKKAKYDQTELDLAQVAQELASLSTRKKVYDEQVSQLRTERQKVEAEQEKLQADQLNFSNLKSDLTRKIELFDVQKDSSEKSAAEREERLENLKIRVEITQKNMTEVQKK